MNGHTNNFGPVFVKNHNSRKHQKNVKPWGIYVFSLLVWMKNHKLAIRLFYKMSVHKMNNFV